MTILETRRLALRLIGADDAPFILGLLNEPSFLRFIGDRGVRTLDDARAYIENGPVASYARHGLGLWLAQRREDGTPIGMCGLLKRDTLDDVDIGFAYLPAYWGQGYAYEAAAAVMDHGRRVLGIPRIVAIVSPDNAGSIRLLEKIGLVFERRIDFNGEDRPTCLYVPAPTPGLP
ncbi:MAG: GNAT family N-acetyltransferase [Steroidobacteraceae bacterium]